MKEQKGKETMQESRREGNVLNPQYNIDWNTGGWDQEQTKAVLYVGAKNKR